MAKRALMIFLDNIAPSLVLLVRGKNVFSLSVYSLLITSPHSTYIMQINEVIRIFTDRVSVWLKLDRINKVQLLLIFLFETCDSLAILRVSTHLGIPETRNVS